MSNKPRNPIARSRIPKGKKNQRFKYDPSYIPAVQNLTAMGLNEALIGMVLGFSEHTKDNDWLAQLKQNHPEIAEAWKNGKVIANANLVTCAYREACGYDVDEVDEEYEYRFMVDENDNIIVDKDGKFKTTKVKVKQKVKKRRKPGDSVLLKYLLSTQLPEYFKEVRKLEIDKRELKGEFKADMSSQEIRGFAGRLLDLADETEQEESKPPKKFVESEIIDIDFEEDLDGLFDEVDDESGESKGILSDDSKDSGCKS